MHITSLMTKNLLGTRESCFAISAFIWSISYSSFEQRFVVGALLAAVYGPRTKSYKNFCSMFRVLD